MRLFFEGGSSNSNFNPKGRGEAGRNTVCLYREPQSDLPRPYAIPKFGITGEIKVRLIQPAGSIQAGPLFAGLLTRVETGWAVICSAG